MTKRISVPDPARNAARKHKVLLLTLSVCCVALIAAIAAALGARAQFVDARDNSLAFEAANALVLNKPSIGKVAVIDPRERVWTKEVQVTAARLNIDWSARLGTVERAVGSKPLINALRVDAQKELVELKAEVPDTLQLLGLQKALIDAGLDARVVRVARAGQALETTVQITWTR